MPNMHEIEAILQFSGVGLAVVWTILNVVLTVGVFQIARQREVFGGPGNVFMNAFFWGLATLFGGIYTAAIYWLIHLSKLSQDHGTEHHSESDSR